MPAPLVATAGTVAVAEAAATPRTAVVGAAVPSVQGMEGGEPLPVPSPRATATSSEPPLGQRQPEDDFGIPTLGDAVGGVPSGEEASTEEESSEEQGTTEDESDGDSLSDESSAVVFDEDPKAGVYAVANAVEAPADAFGNTSTDGRFSDPYDSDEIAEHDDDSSKPPLPVPVAAASTAELAAVAVRPQHPLSPVPEAEGDELDLSHSSLEDLDSVLLPSP